jgi:ribonucleoside-diphosphate reductase alpha chain
MEQVLIQHANRIGVDSTLIQNSMKSILNLTSEDEQLNEIARICSDNNIIHPNWGLLAGNMEMERIHRSAPATFSDACDLGSFLLDQNYYKFISGHKMELNKMVHKERDFMYNFFSVNSLRKTYLMRINKDGIVRMIETPQYMLLRVATFIHYPNIEMIRKVYDDMSLGKYTHATPTLCNAGLKRPQLSSCFLLQIPDSMGGISESWKASAVISMNMGGLGKDYSALRHSEIGFNGVSRGVGPWIRVEAEIMRTVDQGGQKRKGSQTAYLCDWHVDIFEFLEMKKETTPEDIRALDMTYGIIVSDEFMRRVRNDEMWTLFCPNKTGKLYEKWGIDFENAYHTLEEKFKDDLNKSYVKRVKARDLWKEILLTQIETGMPFIIYKDAANLKSNQKNLGTIRCSNLCTEIMEFVSEEEIASCNLASLCLNSCVVNGEFRYDLLAESTRQLVINLNQTIDRNYYPADIPQIKYANLKNRPLGIGVQGLADVFAMLDMQWECEEAQQLNENIFEVIYYNAIKQSALIAKERGCNYDSFEGSPISNGWLQFDLWHMEKYMKDHEGRELTMNDIKNYKCAKPGRIYSEEQWIALRALASKHMYNSLLTTIMPTASSAGILGNNEAVEPYTENIFTRSVLSGQFVVMNPHLVDDFEKRGIWTTPVVCNIIENKGSIQNIDKVVQIDDMDNLKAKYKTVFEISQKHLMDMNIRRGKYICQSQSHNCWMKTPTFEKLHAYHFHAWRNGAKTGMYYLRSKPTADPLNFSLDTIVINPSSKGNPPKGVVCTDDVCIMCQS